MQNNILDNNISNNNLFDIDNVNNVYDKNSYKYDEYAIGSSYSSFVTPGVDMVVTNRGDYIVRQTKEYYIFESNRTKICMFTAILMKSDEPNGYITRVGLFDNHNDKTEDTGGNGIFFKLEDGKLCVCVRYGTIDQTDICICRDCFSHDKLDGYGPSKIRLTDFNQMLTFRIEFEGDNYSTIRWYIYVNGMPILINVYSMYQHRDILIKSNYLPIRYEITKTGDEPTIGILSQFNSSLQIVGCYNPQYLIKHETVLAEREAKFSVTSFPEAKFSIRLQKKYNRAVIRNLVANVYTNADVVAPIIISIVRNPIFTSHQPEWIPKNNSLIEYDITACHIDYTNSEIIHVEYMNDQHFNNPNTKYSHNIILTSNIQGISDIFTITFKKIRNVQTCYATFNWLEYY